MAYGCTRDHSPGEIVLKNQKNRLAKHETESSAGVAAAGGGYNSGFDIGRTSFE